MIYVLLGIESQEHIHYGLSDNDILEKLQDKLNISMQMAQEYLLKFGK